MASLPTRTLSDVVPAYGLDIETDTAADGLNPRRSSVLAAAVAGPEDVIVIDGPEPVLLAQLDRHLAGLPAGVIVTWNGSAFDLPFLSDRAAACGVTLGLALRHDPGIVRRHPPLPGHPGAYRATWHGHRHLDAYAAYRSLEGPDFSCALKAVAARTGLAAVQADAARVHELTRADLRRYVASDARLALRLARLRWDESVVFADPLPA